MENFTIYRTVPVKITDKGIHIRKIGGRVYGGFYKDMGDVPVATFNEITKKMEPVINPRGFGYARRNDRSIKRAKARTNRVCSCEVLEN